MRLRFNLIKFLFILFFIFLLIVAVYQIYCYFYVSASTEYTTVIECEDTVTVSGYFLRDESVIRAENSKYIDITVNSGEKISKNGIIANVYSTEDSAKIQSQIRELQLRIDEMNSVISAANGYNTGATYENEIKKYAINVSSNISEGNITAAFEAAADFSSNIIKSKISAGEIVDYSSKLSELKAQMEQLKAKSSAVTSYITAPSAGYYVSKADGLEDKLSMQLSDDITPDKFDKIVNTINEQTDFSSNYIGKLVSGSQWRVCFKTDSDKFDKIKVGSTVNIRIPSVTDTKIKCTVLDIKSVDGFTYVVLESNVISGDILLQRSCEIDVIIDSYRGLRVDKNAIRKVDGKEGVYVRNNGILKYREVDILYIGSTFAVVKYDALNTSGLQAYDEVVIIGSDLYDGKVVA